MNTIFEDFKNAFKRGDNSLTQLIIINVVVFVFVNLLRLIANLSSSPGLFKVITTLTFLPAPLGRFVLQPWTLFTYFFTHEGLFHIFFNMLFLYYFGQVIREYLGNKRLVALYVLGGISGGVLYLLLFNLIPFYVQQAGGLTMIGASGAVYAVVVGAATLMPNLTFNLILIGPVRIVYIAAFFVVTSFFAIDGSNAGGEIAHLGGALLGFLFIRQLQRGNDWGRPINNLFDGVQNLFRRKPRMRVTRNEPPRRPTAKPTARPTQPDEAEIDAILDKISRSGYDSLTKEEKRKLFSASRKD